MLIDEGHPLPWPPADQMTAALAHLAGQRLHRIRRRVPAHELVGALQEGRRCGPMHAADELGCPMRADLELLVDVAANGRLARTVVEQATRKAKARIASDEAVDKCVLVDRRITHRAVYGQNMENREWNWIWIEEPAQTARRLLTCLLGVPGLSPDEKMRVSELRDKLARSYRRRHR